MSYQIIGLDLADENSEDYSVIMSSCSHCNSILKGKSYKHKENDLNFIIYKNCPVCGIKFERHIIQE